MRPPLRPTYADLHWDEHGLPLSQRFNDFYFSRANGLAEARYVFLQHNRLPQRWQTLPSGQLFSIGETGFGTGLNFLTCWLCWRQHAPAGTRLHFISVERYPLSSADLKRALSLWPPLGELSAQLLAQYPPVCEGSHRLSFDQGRVRLTLIFNDAVHAYERLNSTLDAWFLDGFSPAKNSAMWSQALFDAIASCSHQGTTFSTFTAASAVQRGLQAAGFQTDKAKGFGKKRQMIFGCYAADQTTSLANTQSSNNPPQPSATAFQQPWYDQPKAATDGEPIAVIGAGLAGACSAFALAERGRQVHLFERGAAPGCGASGNPQGVLYAKLPAVPTLHSRIHLSGYRYSLRLLQQLEMAEHWSACGVLQLALTPTEAKKQQRLLQQGHYPDTLVRHVDRAQASQLAGYPLTAGGLFFAEAGWVSPAELCRKLLSHPNIHCHFNQPISTIEFDQSTQRWQMLDQDQTSVAQSAVLVVATANEAAQFQQLSDLPLKSIRGQTSSVTATTRSPALKTVVCGNGYIAPAHQQRYCFGASFDLHNRDRSIDPKDHQHNLDLIGEISPVLAEQLQSQMHSIQGRVGFRCAAPDYLPIVGAIADRAAFLNNYAPLRRDAKAKIDIPPEFLPGLFVNLGHGSKGLITAPLTGALLADIILGHSPAMEPELIRALNPSRFIIKKLIKGSI